MITDAGKADKKKNTAILDTFSEHGIEVKLNQIPKMHLKMAITDESIIINGSYNFTEASASKNQEQLITIENVEITQKWTAIYDELWNSPNINFGTKKVFHEII